MGLNKLSIIAGRVISSYRMRDGTLNRRIYVVVGKKGKIRKIISYWLLEQQIISEELRAANLVALSLYCNYIRRFKTLPSSQIVLKLDCT